MNLEMTKKTKIIIAVVVSDIIVAGAGLGWFFANKEKLPSAHDIMATGKGDNVTEKYFLSATPTKMFPKNGGVATIKVTSFMKNKEGKNKKIPWNISFSVDSGKTYTDSFPSWANVDCTQGKGSTKAEMVAVTLSRQQEECQRVVGYDLSTAGDTKPRNTANCYLVNMPGTYRIPLVYGNAIKNGNANTSAYMSRIRGRRGNVMDFVNHRGKPIEKPWLRENGCKPDSAMVVWQDHKGMIASVGMEKDFLTFAVSDSAMTGNAVIAAVKNDSVCWSWHVWLTRENMERVVTVHTTEKTYAVAPSYLGWTENDNPLWEGTPERVLLIKIQQNTKDKKEIVIAARQQGMQKKTKKGYFYCTYYQWGRKDPETGAERDGNTPKTGFDIHNKEVANFYAPAKAVQATILFPAVHFSNGKDDKIGPAATAAENLWNNTDMPHMQKTVYDPCPQGFCVPSAAFLNVITEIGEHRWDDSRKEKIWFMGKTELTFPAMGMREDKISSFWYNGIKGGCWAADGGNRTHQQVLSFSEEEFIMAYTSKAMAYPIMPIREQ